MIHPPRHNITPASIHPLTPSKRKQHIYNIGESSHKSAFEIWFPQRFAPTKRVCVRCWVVAVVDGIPLGCMHTVHTHMMGLSICKHVVHHHIHIYMRGHISFTLLYIRTRLYIKWVYVYNNIRSVCACVCIQHAAFHILFGRRAHIFQPLVSALYANIHN